MLLNVDPWKSSGNSVVEVPINAFEDDFRPVVYNKLPDSDQYLASLEAKLRKIKADPDVLKQLTQKREECMNRLLSNNDYSCENDAALDEPIENSTVMRTILPQKQALIQGEVMELVKYDQLENENVDKSEIN